MAMGAAAASASACAAATPIRTPVNEPGPAPQPIPSNSPGAMPATAHWSLIICSSSALWERSAARLSTVTAPPLRSATQHMRDDVSMASTFACAQSGSAVTGAAAAPLCGSLRFMMVTQKTMERALSIPRLDLQQAIARITQTVRAVPETELIATVSAGQRVTASALTAPIDLPPFVSSAMDGYAYDSARYRSDAPLALVGAALAGHPYSGTLGAQQCIRITTGAALPPGADTVVIQEDVVATATTVTISAATAAGANVRAVGHDVAAGALLLAAGERLNPFKLSWLAASGIAEVEVRRKPTIAIMSTGDELIAPGKPLAPGQIYDSNRLLLAELLTALPVDVIDGGCIADDPDAITQALQHLASADLVITSGGVSVGDADYLTDIVARHGSLDFWRLNLKPGKPLAFGSFGSAHYLGLPGNPVSSAVTFLLIARPLILALAGARQILPLHTTARLTAAIRHRPGREEYQRGIAALDNGESIVAPSGDQSSNRLSSFREANCLIRVPKEAGNLDKGQLVEILPLEGLI